jgi:ssDNA-specific exonuclease RecJ
MKWLYQKIRNLGFIKVDDHLEIVEREVQKKSIDCDALMSALKQEQQSRRNELIRDRDNAYQQMYAYKEQHAAVVRAMGKVRTATAQILENADELKHWLAKHCDSADLDADLIHGDDADLGLHHGE